MKDNKIDNLFKEKLAGHSKAPSPMAWEKLNSELSKTDKKVRFLWWQKAAVLLLVCVSGFLIFRNGDVSNENQLASTPTKTEEDRQQTVSHQQLEERENLQAENLSRPANEIAPPVKIEPIEPAEEKNSSSKVSNGDRALFLESAVVNNYIAVNGGKNQEESDHEEGGVLDKVKDDDKTKKTPPPVTIEFRSGKRKKERTLMADAEKEASPEDPSFSFKRLVATVKDVKAGDLGLAELRQAKDDLFAFDTYKEESKNRDK